MKMRVLKAKWRVEIKNETRVFLESLIFEIEMRVSQMSDLIRSVDVFCWNCLDKPVLMVGPKLFLTFDNHLILYWKVV